MAESALDISAYCQGLEATARARYLQKIELCDGFDPYCLKKKDFLYDLKDIPMVEFPDISKYLVVLLSDKLRHYLFIRLSAAELI